MNQRKFFRYNLFGIFVFASLVFLSSCDDDPSEIGIGIQPDEDLYELKKDTFNVFKTDVLKSEGIDTLYTKNIPYNCLGYLNDSVLGMIETDFFCRLSTPFFLDTVNSILKLDQIYEAQLQLELLRINKDTTDKTTINIYLLDNYPEDEKYSTIDASIYASNTIIGTITIDSLRKDTTIKIPLNQAFIKNILSLDTSILNNQEKFNQEFKGIYVTTHNYGDKGAINLCRPLNSSQNKILVNYITTEEDSFSAGLFVEESIGRFKHNYTEDINSIINDETTSDSLLYIQTLGGLTSTIELPDLSYLKDSMPVVVNLARLTVPVRQIKPADDSLEILYLSYLNQEGYLQPIIDYDNNFSPAYWMKENDNEFFEFHFTKLLNQYLTLNKNLPEKFYIKIVNKYLMTYPTKFTLENSDTNPIKLTIIYNKLY